MTPTIDAPSGAPLRALAGALAGLDVQWCHFPAGPASEPGELRHIRIAARTEPNREPVLPALRWDHVRRWTHTESWTPPETLALVRHRRIGGEQRVVTHHRFSPPGFAIEWDLGVVQRFQPPGTAELRRGGTQPYSVIADTDESAPRLREPQHPDYLGSVEEAPLPLLLGLETAFHPPSGEWVLVNGEGDPLLAEVTERHFLGYVEGYPNLPRMAPRGGYGYGVVPLLRTVDTGSRRHRYAVGQPAAGELSAELGALRTVHGPGLTPLSLADGRVVTGQPTPQADRKSTARWVVAPLTWRDSGGLQPRARAAARRALSAVLPQPDRAAPNGTLAGYLWSQDGPHRRPLYAAMHPITGDQLVTPWPLEAADLGYGQPELLGWVSTWSITGSLAARPVSVPWASRFGRKVRYA